MSHRMVEIKGQSVTMLAIGPMAEFPPEMIAMATWYPCSTPYGAYSIAESAERPVTEKSAADEYSSAASAIGNDSQFSVSIYPLRIWPECRPARRNRSGRVDWDRWFGPATGERVQDRAGIVP